MGAALPLAGPSSWRSTLARVEAIPQQALARGGRSCGAESREWLDGSRASHIEERAERFVAVVAAHRLLRACCPNIERGECSGGGAHIGELLRQEAQKLVWCVARLPRISKPFNGNQETTIALPHHNGRILPPQTSQAAEGILRWRCSCDLPTSEDATRKQTKHRE